jgi:hypothetical protein
VEVVIGDIDDPPALDSLSQPAVKPASAAPRLPVRPPGPPGPV